MALEKIPANPNDPLPTDDELFAELHQINIEGFNKTEGLLDRKGDIENAQAVLAAYLDNGIAYEMPLSNVLGFLVVQEKEANKGRLPNFPGDIRAAKETLVSLLGKNLSEKSLLADVMKFLETEKKELEDLAKA